MEYAQLVGIVAAVMPAISIVVFAYILETLFKKS